MFLRLNHKNLAVYNLALQLLRESYQTIQTFPFFENYNLTKQIRRAAVSVILNIAEGASRPSNAERKRFYEIARGSLIEIDAAFEVSCSLQYTSEEKLKGINALVNSVFAMLSKMISTLENNHH